MKIQDNQIKKWAKRSAITGVVLFLLFLMGNWIFPVPDKIEYSTVITDNKGEVVHAYLTRDQQWRMKTEINEVSPLLRTTLIQKEDKYFYQHPGVNIIAMGRAFFKNLFRMKRTSGASTITMQVARSLEPKRRTYLNKLIEIFRAFQLEWKYSKDEILLMYLNRLPYGGNIQGVKSASLLYFKKNPDHLSLAEIVALSIIPNRPSSLVMGKNNELIVKERNRWLQQFAKEKIFIQKEIADALNEPLTASRGIVPKYIPHFAYQLKKQGGDIIHTHIEMNTQLKTQKLVEDYARTLRLKNIRNAAVVIINNTTHQVITYVGSANEKDTIDGGQVNGAGAVRQPGSTLKPLIYAMCLDEGLLTPKLVLSDVAINYNGYAPENYDRKFNGFVTMEYALEHSLNIPAVKSLQMLGKDKLAFKLGQCQFKQIKKDQKKLGLSMALGGCGATLEELTALYSVFANEGNFFAPSNTSADGKGRSSISVISPSSTFMINDILSKVNRPDFPLNWQSTERMPKIAWKTGTSYGRRDGWSIGYNKHFTVGAWIGNFSGVGNPEISGANVATPLLFKIFNTIDYDSDEQWFTQPEGCDIRQICAETGLPPSENCTNLITDYFIPLLSPNRKCDNKKEIMISADEKLSYCPHCVPLNGYKKKWYTKISPDMQHWLEENKIAFTAIPTHNPGCEIIFKEGAPLITSPANGTEYLISKKNPEPIQLVCQAGNDVSNIYWYINDKFYKTSEGRAKQFFLPDEGPIKISCTDDKGRNRNVWIKVRYVNL
jgi:penicillin-binding protein 1C